MKKKEIDKSLYKKKLKIYVKENLKKGFSIELIKRKLIESNIEPLFVEEIIEEAKKSKNKYYLAFLVLLLISTTIILFNIHNTYDSRIQDIKIVRIEEYPPCLKINNSIERYYCYRSLNRERNDVYLCGFFFIGYEKDIKEYEPKMKEGEIIFSIDEKPVYRDEQFYLYNSNFDNFIATKNIGEIAKIKTNINTYYYPYLEGPNGKAVLYFILGSEGYCYKK